jgi:hypothetical protein
VCLIIPVGAAWGAGVGIWPLIFRSAGGAPLWCLAAAAATLAGALAACGSNSPHSVPAQPPAPVVAGAPAAGTVWATVLSPIGFDGTVSLPTALEAFVLSVGLLPGVAEL